MLKNWLERQVISRRAALLGSTAAAVATAAGGTAGEAAEAVEAAGGAARPRSHAGHAARHPGMLGDRLRPPAARKAPAGAPAATPAPAPIPLPLPPTILLKPGEPATLPMKAQSYQLGDRTARNLRVYDNVSAPQYLMGPTLEMGQNGLFLVNLVNGLPLNPDQDKPHIVNIPSQFNTTNLHTHGLHVSPKGHSDNAYLEILPEGTAPAFADGVTSFVGRFGYAYDLKAHTPGTFWYHPHRHGSVAVQLASGAAGALIVRGGDDTVDGVPGIKGVKEQVLLIQQVVLDAQGELPDFDTLWNYTGSGAAATWTVNGTVGATLAMQPGEVQRWRIVNTGFQAEAKFALLGNGDHPLDLQLIAMDGVNFSPDPATVKAVYLPPGGRADILVKAPDRPAALRGCVGRYVKIDQNFAPASGMTAGFKIGGRWREAPFIGAVTDLFSVAVGGAPKPMLLPAAGSLPAPLVPAIAGTTPAGYRYVNFDVKAFTNPTSPPCDDPLTYRPDACPTSFKFQVNGELFCPGRVMFQPPLGSVDAYFVDSPGLHVYHIHVNPFLVTEVNGQTLSTPMWRDTMLAGPKGYRALTQYTDYSGTFPLHCHILDHEDVGMMTNVTVVDPADPAGSLPTHAGHSGH